jgi:hypothetical protein
MPWTARRSRSGSPRAVRSRSRCPCGRSSGASSARRCSTSS